MMTTPRPWIVLLFLAVRIQAWSNPLWTGDWTVKQTQQFDEKRSNTTDFTVNSSLRNVPGMQQQQHQQQQQENPSLARAIHHTHAILDLYNASSELISPRLIETALIATVSAAENLSSQEFNLLQELIGKYNRMLPLPKRTMSNLYDIIQRETSNVRPSQQARRVCQLLTLWISFNSPAPFSHVIDLLQFCKSHNLHMTKPLWELYQVVRNDRQYLQRASKGKWLELYTLLDQILSLSSLPSSSSSSSSLKQWQAYRIRLLQDATPQILSSRYPNEWVHSVAKACARRGKAQDVAWMARHFDHMESYFVEALTHCERPGALTYMEKLLLSDDWQPFLEPMHITLLLQKWARTSNSTHGQYDIGMRAESIWQWKERMASYNQTFWPTIDDTKHVLVAYQNNRQCDDAERFARRYVQNYIATTENKKRSARIDEHVHKLLNDTADSPKDNSRTD